VFVLFKIKQTQSDAFPTLVGGHHSLGATFLGSYGDLIVGTCIWKSVVLERIQGPV